MDTSANSFGSNDGLNLDAFIYLACLVVDILTASIVRLTSLT